MHNTNQNSAGTAIRAIIWDIGGVLWRIKDKTSHRKWETHLGLAEGELAEIIFGSSVALRATIGEATPEEVWDRVGKDLELSVEKLKTLRIEIWEGGVWDTDLLSYIGRLKIKHKTGIISDAWLDARAVVSEWINEELFDVIMFSAEEGVQKPNPIIYERMLERLGVKAEEAIFIDDWKESVEGAQKVGMIGIQYTDGVNVRVGIERIIDEVEGS